MGWWNVQNTNIVIGDGPLETLEGAVAGILSQYEAAFQRKPTRSEWESLLTAVLASASSEERVTDEGEVDQVHVDLKVDVKAPD